MQSLFAGSDSDKGAYSRSGDQIVGGKGKIQIFSLILGRKRNPSVEN
jgi:hypothetical protein